MKGISVSEFGHIKKQQSCNSISLGLPFDVLADLTRVEPLGGSASLDIIRMARPNFSLSSHALKMHFRGVPLPVAGYLLRGVSVTTGVINSPMEMPPC